MESLICSVTNVTNGREVCSWVRKICLPVQGVRHNKTHKNIRTNKTKEKSNDVIICRTNYFDLR